MKKPGSQKAISERKPYARLSEDEKLKIVQQINLGLIGHRASARKYGISRNYNSIIKDFKWINQSKETGMPYDFEITNLDNSIVFSDAKSTSYKFELPIILSSGELNFINHNKDKYLIHRLY